MILPLVSLLVLFASSITNCNGYTVSRLPRKTANCDCGVAQSQRIFNGRTARVDSYPWLAKLERDGAQWCGGAIIDAQHILTAGHCVLDAIRGSTVHYDVERIKVRVAAHEMKNSGKVYDVQAIFMAPEYHYIQETHNDMAIIRLTKPLKYGKKVQPICLPNSPLTEDKLAKQQLKLAGWGSIAPGIVSPNALQEVELDYIKAKKCNDDLHAYFLKKFGYRKSSGIHEHHMCALNHETKGDSCKGDSGGPLMYRDSNTDHYFAVGVVSGAVSQCGQGQPGYYTRVTDFQDFIQSHATQACWVDAQ